jgi:hypothetical protein
MAYIAIPAFAGIYKISDDYLLMTVTLFVLLAVIIIVLNRCDIEAILDTAKWQLTFIALFCVAISYFCLSFGYFFYSVQLWLPSCPA